MLRLFYALCLATFLTIPALAQFQTANPEGQYVPPPYPEASSTASYPDRPSYDAQGGGGGDQTPDPNDQDHGVARLSIIQGDVNLKRGDNGQLTAAVVNAPLLAHDHLETSAGSRAELQFDSANFIRLAPGTDLGIASLIANRYQLQLGIGSVIVRVVRPSQMQAEIDTPSVGFRPLGQGEYRISVFDNGSTQISVRSGRIEMSGPRGSQTVTQGQTLLIRGDSSDPEFQQTPEAMRDQLDDWSATRDNELLALRNSPSAQYVNSDIYGAEDLDRYGSWVPSQYGQVWAPQGQPADWSPYSTGQWTYADYYGWTWVDSQPWGWAPYHYGRWFYNGGVGWCWWPGARGGFYRNHWSPGLVSFFGFGGGLGWVALAPYESYHPWWGRYGGYNSFRYSRFDVGRYYRNAGVRGGALTAPINGFSGVGRRYNVATRGQLSGAELYSGRLPVSPNSNSYRLSERATFSNPRFSQAASSRFYSVPQRQQPQQQQFNAPASGWQRFGSPGVAAPPRVQQNFSRSNESGWHNFGQAQQTYTAPQQRYNFYTPSRSQTYSAPQRYNYNGAAAPRYSAPAPRYNAPSPHFSAPSAPRGGGSSGGGGSHSSGGGGGGHRGR